MNVGARAALALTAGATAGAIALLLATRQDLLDNGIPFSAPVIGTVTIKPSLSTSPAVLGIGATAAIVALVLVFAVSA